MRVVYRTVLPSAAARFFQAISFPPPRARSSGLRPKQLDGIVYNSVQGFFHFYIPRSVLFVGTILGELRLFQKNFFGRSSILHRPRLLIGLLSNVPQAVKQAHQSNGGNRSKERSPPGQTALNGRKNAVISFPVTRPYTFNNRGNTWRGNRPPSGHTESCYSSQSSSGPRFWLASAACRSWRLTFRQRTISSTTPTSSAAAPTPQKARMVLKARGSTSSGVPRA